MIQDEAAEADAIADLVNKLAILHGDPERFHLVRDEAARRLRRMAARIRGDGRKHVPTTTWRPSDAAARLRGADGAGADRRGDRPAGVHRLGPGRTAR